MLIQRSRASWSTRILFAGQLAAVVTADLATGADLSLALFYVFPGAFVAWRGGKAMGMAAGAVCTLAWLGVEFSWRRHYANPVVPWYNFGVQFLATETAALLVAAVAGTHAKLTREVAVRRETEGKLAVANHSLERRVAERSAAAERRANELERSESALRGQTRLLRSILGCMAEAVVVVDDQGGVRLSNPAAARAFGRASDDISTEGWSAGRPLGLGDLMDGVGCVRPPDQWRRPADGEELLFRRPGLEKGAWFRLNSRPLIDDQGASLGAVLVLTDISSAKERDRLAADVIEREQRRIGQELHDGLGQQLVSAAFAAAMLTDRLAEKAVVEADAAAELGRLIHDAITQVRDLARVLHPIRLEEGLGSALTELTDQVGRATPVACATEVVGDVRIGDAAVASNLYRLAQEAVNNAVKHARPSQIVVRLERRGARVVLTIENDGRRFEGAPEGSRGIGLEIMRRRARAIGAELEIGPGPAGGARVCCDAPAAF